MTQLVDAHVRLEVEDFLYREAELLDRWDLDGWLELFTPEGDYLIPPLDGAEGDPGIALHLVADDPVRLHSRVHQLLARSAWAENPKSRTRRLVTNVRAVERDGGPVHVRANFVVHRFTQHAHDSYVGEYDHELVRTLAGLRFARRTARLDHTTLRPHGKVSVII